MRPHRRSMQQGGTTHEHNAGGDRAAQKRPGQAVDADARTARRRDRHEAADFVRTVAGDLSRCKAPVQQKNGQKDDR